MNENIGEDKFEQFRMMIQDKFIFVIPLCKI